jgi:branched-chain amino acid transport system substrate-binding protein
VVSKKIVAVVAALATTVAIAGCSTGTSSTASPDTPFLVYANLPLTGTSSSAAQAQLDGLHAAANQINEQGGIAGHQIKVVSADDQLDPTKAVQLLQQQLTSAKPNLVITGNTSNEALALLPLLTRNKVLSTGSPQSEKLNDPATYPYGFTVTTQNATDARALVTELQSRNITKIGFIAGNDAIGENTIATYQPVLTVEQYSPDELDFSTHLQRIEASAPQLIVAAPTGAAIGRLLAARTAAGITTPLLGTTSLGDGTNLSLVSGPADWVNVQTMVIKANSNQFTPNAGSQALLARLKADGSKLDQVMQQYSLPWDALYLAKYAAEQAGSIDAPEMAKALENQDPVSNSMLVTFPVEKYSSTNHFFIIDDLSAAFAVIKPGPVADGTIQSAG